MSMYIKLLQFLIHTTGQSPVWWAPIFKAFRMEWSYITAWNEYHRIRDVIRNTSHFFKMFAHNQNGYLIPNISPTGGSAVVMCQIVGLDYYELNVKMSMALMIACLMNIVFKQPIPTSSLLKSPVCAVTKHGVRWLQLMWTPIILPYASLWNGTYRKVSNIRRTKSQNLNASRLIL